MNVTNTDEIYTAEDLRKHLRKSGIDIPLKDVVKLLSQITDEKRKN
ncbi:MAG: hypothetical protein WCC17_09495 [Candidatus Nitrosopolaris sp.]